MKKKARLFGLIVALLFLLAILGLPVLAQDDHDAEAEAPDQLTKEQQAEIIAQILEHDPDTIIADDVFEYNLRGVSPASDFGQLSFHSTWVPASAFQQLGTPSWSYVSGGYISRNNNTASPWFWAPLNLPSGSDIGRIRFYYWDSSATSNIGFYYVRYNTALNTKETLKVISSTGTLDDYRTMYFDPSPYNIFDNFHQYSLEVHIDIAISDPSIRFKGARVTYLRTISPAPTTATFPDVPTTHGFFRNIEALAASGITTGFSDGTYRPNDYVTRGQMAAFLSRALGLFHAESW